uniref:Uncharacterized protein n=1 Tax=Plectus sambesii TaxID=2011161 RepID=A0A914XF22_9BILA
MPRSFAVTPVDIGRNVPKSISVADAAQAVRNFWAIQNPAMASLEFESGNVNHSNLVASSQPNAVIATLVEAYNGHMPLILSPDDFWLLISLGVSQYLGRKENAEKNRKTFVDHEDKLKLIVDGLPLGIPHKCSKNVAAGWPQFAEEMRELISLNTTKDGAQRKSSRDGTQIMTKNFSTTGPVEAAVFEMGLMESMKNYFEYTCVLLRGIPKVTLDGESNDYFSIIERIDALITLLSDFEWYLKRVKAHMEKVLASFEGDPDINWWRRMVMSASDGMEGAGDRTALSGWISDFFPYRHFAGKTFLNQSAESRFKYFRAPAVTCTPVKLLDGVYTMKTYDMKFMGGFVGVAAEAIEKEEIALRPAIGWFTYYRFEEEVYKV